jgi:hypothetical protein
VNLSSGGLAILAIAAIWFLVFLPSFVKGDQAKNDQREKLAEAEESTKARLGERAQKALGARRTRTIFAIISVVAFVVAGLAVLGFAVNGTGLPLAIGSVFVTGVTTWATYRAHQTYRAHLTGSVRRSVPISSPVAVPTTQPEQSANGWQPQALPKQSFLQTGAIEVVELAEVVDLEIERAAEQDIRIDEILRRRRHIG